MNDAERRYVYRHRWTVIVLCAAFFGLGAVVLGAKAVRNDRGVVINRVIELGPEGATAFYWVLAALSAGFVLGAGLLVIHRVTYRQRLAFGPTALVVPASRWSSKEVEIAYRDVRQWSQVEVSGERLLQVFHLGGKYTITASMLASRTAFDEVCELLADREAAARA